MALTSKRQQQTDIKNENNTILKTMKNENRPRKLTYKDSKNRLRN